MSEAVDDFLDDLDEIEDVQEELVHIEAWDRDILFRGLSLASLEIMSDADIVAGQAGNFAEAVRLVRATAAHPKTKELLFASERGELVLRKKGYEGVMECLNKGTLVVLGVDAGETAGKDSSSTVTEATATA